MAKEPSTALLSCTMANSSKHWIVFRNFVTLGKSAVGVGLLLPVNATGLPIPALAWLGLVICIQVAIVRLNGEPWSGFGEGAHDGAPRGGLSFDATHRRLTVLQPLMILDDLLLLVLLGVALVAGVFFSVGWMHYFFVAILVCLIWCSSMVNSHLGRNHDV